MRGRRPKPIAKHIADGDPSKHGKHVLERRLEAEPKPTGELSACPKHLTGRARRTWNFWTEELSAMKLSKRPDNQMLEGACVAYARAVAADLILEKEGLIVKENYIDEAGEVHVLKIRKHPAVDISNRSWLIVKAFCCEFGLSPVSRMRLVVPKDAGEDHDDLVRLLSQPRLKREESPAVN